MSREEEKEHDDAQDERVLTVRVPVAAYRVVRTIAVTTDKSNADVIAWAIELLEKHVAAGGAR